MIIQVDMYVTRHRIVGDVVQVWGYVGDYETCVFITRNEAEDRGIVPKRKLMKRVVNGITYYRTSLDGKDTWVTVPESENE